MGPGSEFPLHSGPVKSLAQIRFCARKQSTEQAPGRGSSLKRPLRVGLRAGGQVRVRKVLTRSV